MAKIFYDHIVKVEEIILELERIEIDAVDKEEIIQLADETLHHHTLDVILTHLPKERHEEFLSKFHLSPGEEKLLDYLKKETNVDIEKEIEKEAKKIKREIIKEIKASKK